VSTYLCRGCGTDLGVMPRRWCRECANSDADLLIRPGCVDSDVERDAREWTR
jgi:hypothetical protein